MYRSYKANHNLHIHLIALHMVRSLDDQNTLILVTWTIIDRTAVTDVTGWPSLRPTLNLFFEHQNQISRASLCGTRGCTCSRIRHQSPCNRAPVGGPRTGNRLCNRRTYFWKHGRGCAWVLFRARKQRPAACVLFLARSPVFFRVSPFSSLQSNRAIENQRKQTKIWRD